IIVQQKIYEALGPGGLNWLVDNSDANSTVDVNDVVLAQNTASDVRYSVRLKQSLARVVVPVDFDLGLPILGLDVNGQVQLDVGFDWDLTFGLDRRGGFYLGTGVSDELKLAFEASTPGLSATAKLGFLTATATDGAKMNGPNSATEFTRVKGAIHVDLRDPGVGPANDGKLFLTEIVSAPLPQVVAAYFPATDAQGNPTNNAQVRLHLIGSINGNEAFPQIHTDLTVDWSFANASTSAGSGSFGTVPVVAFRNVQIDVGQVLTSFAKPILERVNATLAPVQPVLAILQTALPILSQLSGRPYTILDLAEQFGPLFGGSVGKETKNFIKAVADLKNLIDTVNAVSSTGLVNLGDFVLTGGSSSSTVDPRKQPLKDLDLATVPGSQNAIPVSDSKAQEFMAKASAVPASKDANGTGAGFSFPILKNPMGILQILTGQGNVDLFKYDMPELKVWAPIKEIPIPILPPVLMGFFGGGIGAAADFNFGFDSSGFKSGNPFNGFYIEDRVGGTASGKDVREAVLFGRIEVGAQVGGDWGPASIKAGAAGGIEATVGLNLNDPNNDGRVHLNELRENLRRGVEWVFDVQGSVDAYLRAFVDISVKAFGKRVTLYEAEMELARIQLIDFSIPKRGAISDAPLGSQSNGILTLDLNTNEDDNFSIAQESSGTIVVTARGRTQSFASISKIVGSAGKGNDNIVFDASVTSEVDIDGGDGDDRITYSGSGKATLRGGAGNDRLTSSAGDDFIYGGDGDDIIAAGAGIDTIRGEAGNDDILGGAGDDAIQGDAGNDTIDGELGSDTIHGNEGNDILRGGLDNDVIYAGVGDDSVNGDDGSDQLHGESGDDRIDGGLGNDFIFGGDGSDYLDGGKNNDTIYGGTGNDNLYGNGGSDSLYGEDGNDLIIAGVSKAGGDEGAVHFLYGGSGDDEIYGDAGQDVVYAGAGNDRIESLAGNDDVRGEDGDDFIIAGLGSDLVIGGWGRDTIYAGLSTIGGGRATETNLVFGDLESIDRDSHVLALS
ncbi:MAG: calcium-binding protein, partial [Pirellula sp.]